MRKILTFFFVALSVGVTAQTLQPPYPAGTSYQSGGYVSDYGFGITGCKYGEFIKGDLTGCAAVSTPPLVGDAIQFVSANGNDANDGLSWGSAKRTIEAAQTTIEATSSVGTIFLTPTFNETFTTPITIGSNSDFIHVVGYGNSYLTCNVNSPSDNCVNIESGSSLVCLDAGAQGNHGSCYVIGGPLMNVTNILAVGPGGPSIDAGYTNVVGWSLHDGGGSNGIYTGYILAIQSANQPMHVRDMAITAYNGKGLGITAGAGITLENVEVNSQSTGGISCSIGPSGTSSLQSVWLKNVSCEHSVAGTPEIKIGGLGGSGVFRMLQWTGGRVENSLTDTTSTAPIQIAGGDQLYMSLDVAPQGTTTGAYSYQINNGFGTGSITIDNAAEFNSHLIINNLADSTQVGPNSPFLHRISRYFYSGQGAGSVIDSAGGLLLGSNNGSIGFLNPIIGGALASKLAISADGSSGTGSAQLTLKDTSTANNVALGIQSQDNGTGGENVLWQPSGLAGQTAYWKMCRSNAMSGGCGIQIFKGDGTATTVFSLTPATGDTQIAGHFVTKQSYNQGATLPTSSAGTVSAGSSSNSGVITGLIAATTVTLTFGDPFPFGAFCTGTAGVSLTSNVYVSAISKTSVTFNFPSLTGNLYYTCGGN